MPPIPQSILDGLARYAQFRQAQLIAWHPDQAPDADHHVVHVEPGGAADPPGGRPRAGSPPVDVDATEACRPVASASFAPGDPNTFVFQYDSDRGAAIAVPVRPDDRRDLAGRRSAVAICAGVVARRASGSPTTPPSETAGIAICTSSSRRTRRRSAGSPNSTGAFEPAGLVARRDGAARQRGVQQRRDVIWQVDVKTGEKKAITPRDGEKAGVLQRAVLGRRPEGLRRERSDGGDWRVWRCDIANCIWTPVTPEGTSVDAPNTGGGIRAVARRRDCSPSSSTAARAASCRSSTSRR